MDKSETRALAEKFNLPVAAKPDSQDICFVPDGDYARVVERLRPGALDKGDIVDVSGRVLGTHDGVINFTVGQRRGLGIGGGDPLYVVRIEPERRRVVVGPKSALLRTVLTVRDLNWLGAGPGDGVTPCLAKVRSAQPAVAATVRALGGGRAEVTFAEPQGGIAAGQACVLYDGDKVLGGGWIERERSAAATA